MRQPVAPTRQPRWRERETVTYRPHFVRRLWIALRLYALERGTFQMTRPRSRDQRPERRRFPREPSPWETKFWRAAIRVPRRLTSTRSAPVPTSATAVIVHSDVSTPVCGSAPRDAPPDLVEPLAPATAWGPAAVDPAAADPAAGTATAGAGIVVRVGDAITVTVPCMSAKPWIVQ